MEKLIGIAIAESMLPCGELFHNNCAAQFIRVDELQGFYKPTEQYAQMWDTNQSHCH